MNDLERAFEQAMLGRQYGEQERKDAFEWFKLGWLAAIEELSKRLLR